LLTYFWNSIRGSSVGSNNKKYHKKTTKKVLHFLNVLNPKVFVKNKIQSSKVYKELIKA